MTVSWVIQDVSKLAREINHHSTLDLLVISWGISVLFSIVTGLIYISSKHIWEFPYFHMVTNNCFKHFGESFIHQDALSHCFHLHFSDDKWGRTFIFHWNFCVLCQQILDMVSLSDEQLKFLTFCRLSSVCFSFPPYSRKFLVIATPLVFIFIICNVGVIQISLSMLMWITPPVLLVS